MDPDPWGNLGFIEMIIFGMLALGFGFWQLWSVNREIAKDKEKATIEATSDEDDAAAS